MQTTALSIRRLAGELGAEVAGVALNGPEDPDAWAAIHQAFLEHAVLVFRAQTLEPADLMRIGARFGPPCHYPFVTGMAGFPYVFEVVKEPEETRNFGGNWHSDTTYLAQPPLATLLYAVETPAWGGDTLFASTRAAYAALSSGLQRLVDELVGINSAGLKHSGGRTHLHKDIGSMQIHDTDAADRMEAEHPVVRTHPETGRRALYLSRSHTVRFRGWSEEESRALIDYLQAHQTRPEFTCRVSWTPGTLVIWDNRCTQHNAINDYHGQRRRMRRLTVGAQSPR
ncbi:MAG TPA: TauD/TfdA family dioxygenase [Ktedonobacterales bacterium]|nr:TauD/TfdA family dioxygenase [Ktedonobacterales bacterium]